MTNRDKSGRFAKSEVSKKGFPSGARVNSVPSGSTGLKQDHGYIYEEYLPELSGKKATLTYKQMTDNDPIVGAVFFAIEMFLRKVQWFVDPFEENEKGEADAKFLRECKEDMSHTWSDFISEIMSMMTYGWSYLETLYKRRTNVTKNALEDPPSKYNDNKVGWRKFEIRSQDSLEKWQFDEDGGLAGMWQLVENEAQMKFIPIQKALLFRTTVRKNNPEGRSVLRNAYRPWYFKKRIEEIEGVGIERDLAGLPFAEVPAEMMSENASEADKATLASIVELVKNVRRDQQEGVVWPQQWNEQGAPMYTFKLMASSGSRQFDTNTVINRYDSRIAMVVIADFILSGVSQDSSGSYAMTATKSGMFQAALGAWLDVIQDVLNNYAVPRLFRLNGDFSGQYPKFRHDEVQKPSLADLATLVAALTGAGAQLFPDVDLENHFRRLSQFPLREAKDEAKTKEDELREDTTEAAIASAKETIKNPGGPPVALGKQPGSTPGAPTKTTGPVKSKLPPQQRRDTKATRAETGTAEKRPMGRRSVAKRRIKIVRKS